MRNARGYIAMMRSAGCWLCARYLIALLLQSLEQIINIHQTTINMASGHANLDNLNGQFEVKVTDPKQIGPKTFIGCVGKINKRPHH
jgi:hypothetical protein